MNGNIFMLYVFPALLIAVISGVLAFLLAYLGKKLAVKKDERIDKVKDCLAGANCGGCGYAGCAAFAEALVKGETTLDKCSATDVESKTEIAKTLGVEVGDTTRTIAVVHCMGGDACGVKYKCLKKVK